MKTIGIPLNEEQYAEAVKSIEEFAPDIVILDMDFYMMMLKVSSAPVLIGKNKAQKRMELINKIDAYIKDKFKVYHLYAPDFASDVVREERDRQRTLIQKTRDEITGLQDAIFLLSMPLKTAVYSYLKMNQKLAESLEEFERRIENKEFKSSILNKIFEVWIYKRAYKVNEIKKIASENQKTKMLYIGLKSDFSYLPLEQ
jgi:hypothetical protein